MGGLYGGAHHLKCFCSFCCDLLIRKEKAPFVPGADMRDIQPILQNLSASNIHLISAGLSGKSHAIVFVTVFSSSQHTHLDFCFFYSMKNKPKLRNIQSYVKVPFSDKTWSYTHIWQADRWRFNAFCSQELMFCPSSVSQDREKRRFLSLSLLFLKIFGSRAETLAQHPVIFCKRGTTVRRWM